MSRTILVVGNCHIGGIASALRWLFPSDQVSPVPFNPNVFKGDKNVLAARLASADIVMGGGFVGDFMSQQMVVPRSYVKIPSLYFSAFHPDYVTAKVKSTGTRIGSHYNSAICAWAYSNGIEPADAVPFFSKNVFRMLGYYDLWDKSVVRMKSAFDDCGLDFDRFFSAAKRDGVFMYTVNHPKISVLIWLAKLLAIRVGHTQSIWRKEIPIIDALAKVEVWPVYPEVANELSVPGSYTWFVERGRIIDGLREYIEFAYDNYSRSVIRPDEINIIGINHERYQTVLTSELRKK